MSPLQIVVTIVGGVLVPAASLWQVIRKTRSEGADAVTRVTQAAQAIAATAIEQADQRAAKAESAAAAAMTAVAAIEGRLSAAESRLELHERMRAGLHVLAQTWREKALRARANGDAAGAAMSLRHADELDAALSAAA